MKFIDAIKSETLLICSNGIKDKVISRRKLVPIKIMGLDEFIRYLCFDYDEDTIIYICKNYQVKYEVALEYLKNLYYIEDKIYNVEKLDFLVKMKKDLESKQLLKYHHDFKKYIKNVSVILYDIKVSKYLERILDGINYQVIDREYNSYEHIVYSFNTMEEECEFVAIEICKLISSGVSPRKIKLTNIDKKYYSTLERIFSLFNLKINFPYKSKLISFDVVKEFINNYKVMDLNSALEKINKEDPLYPEIIKIINSYIKYENKDLIIYKMENSYLFGSTYDLGIEIVNYLDYISNDDEYIFLMGFNDGVIPNSYKDINYITDNIANLVGLNNTKENNLYLRDKIIKIIGNIKNLVITYKDSDMSESYYPSTMINNFKVVKGEIDNSISYSEIYNKIKLMDRYDNYLRYGILSLDFKTLNNNFKINYNGYKNKYTKINRITDKLTLSYSKMQIYNKCAFRYYLSEILKLDIFEENFSTVIGNMVHYVLEKCLANNDLDTDKYVLEFLDNRQFSKKESFFLEIYKDSIKNLLNEILIEKEYGLFNQAMYEKKVEIPIEKNIKFKGTIDKILYYEEDNNTYISLVDYKTGHDEISLKYLKYGLNMQLPIYLYLSTKLDFNNPVYVGFYLQRLDIKDNDYRLEGYSNSNKDILKIIDKEYDNSKIIKGMKTIKDGSFSRYTKVLSNEDIVNIINETEEKIKCVINNIKNNEFPINPKVINGINKGCAYCKFYDICNVSKNDMININICDDEEMI